MLESIDLQEDKNGERWVTALGGGALLFLSLRRLTWSSPLLGAAGVALLYRSVTGQNPAQEILDTVSQATTDGIHVRRALTVQRTPEDVYRFWQRIENLPRFMQHLESVENLGDGRSRWQARIPGPLPLSWEARLVHDEPGQRLAWQTMPDSALEHEGEIQFLPRDEGRATELHVSLSYNPPLGAAGAAVAQLLNPVTEQQIYEDIRRSKQLLEAGEIATTESQPSGRESA